MKLAFFDIDGTLLNRKGKISPSTKIAVEKLKLAGITPAIATGRPLGMIRWILDELEIHSYITNNGQLGVFQGKTLFNHTLNKEDVHTLSETFNKNKDTLVYVDHENWATNRRYHPRVHYAFHVLKFPYPKLNPRFHTENSVVMCMAFFPKKRLETYQRMFPQWNFIHIGVGGYDVVLKDTTKAAAIQEFVNHLKITPEEVLAFGDGFNDIEMLQFVGMGIAMGQAKKQVKDAANHVTDDHNSDGIYNALIKHNIIEMELHK